MRTLSCKPGVEVQGANILALISNVNAKSIRPLLEKHDLTEIDPEKWYPAERWLNVFNDMLTSPGGMFNLVAVGMEVGQSVPLPPHIQSVKDVVVNWDALYRMQHRGEDIGYIKGEVRSETHYVVIYDQLYPDDFNYGLTYGATQRFLEPGAPFTVNYDPEETRKDEGGERTVIHINLE